MAANSKFGFLLEKSRKLNRSGCTLDHLWGAWVCIAPIFLACGKSLYLDKKSINGKISDFFCAKMGQGTDAKILSLTELGSPRLAHSKNWPPPLRFWKNLGKTFLGVSSPGGPGAKISGAALKCVGALTSGPRGVQNKTGS